MLIKLFGEQSEMSKEISLADILNIQSTGRNKEQKSRIARSATLIGIMKPLIDAEHNSDTCTIY